MNINAISKRIEPLGLEALKQHGLEAFCLIDIRGRQSFEAAHSLHLPSVENIIDFISSQAHLAHCEAQSQDNAPLTHSNNVHSNDMYSNNMTKFAPNTQTPNAQITKMRPL